MTPVDKDAEMRAEPLLTTDAVPTSLRVQQPADKWFEERDHGAGTHYSDCWRTHPGCAYLMGRMEASRAIEAAAEEAARTSRDFGRGFMEAAKVARRYGDA